MPCQLLKTRRVRKMHVLRTLRRCQMRRRRESLLPPPPPRPLLLLLLPLLLRWRPRRLKEKAVCHSRRRRHRRCCLYCSQTRLAVPAEHPQGRSCRQRLRARAMRTLASYTTKAWSGTSAQSTTNDRRGSSGCLRPFATRGCCRGATSCRRVEPLTLSCCRFIRRSTLTRCRTCTAAATRTSAETLSSRRLEISMPATRRRPLHASRLAVLWKPCRGCCPAR
mmetsp:Transcript_25679/g.76004  ORF Transcript_25679/g.76004 Transcript_25679/m.76004 type:complete len:222 (+) Transcript_25679:35-700(+)